MQKIAELEVDRNEHVLVEDTLKVLDGDRRAYRLVGDILVERSVKEVLPSVTSNKDNVRLGWGGFVRGVFSGSFSHHFMVELSGLLMFSWKRPFECYVSA